jgi:hypothetical protein
MASVSTPVSRIAAPVVAAILLVAAIVVFVGTYFLLPQNGHYLALVTIGLLSLVFAAVSYLAQSLSRANPFPQRTLAWGFYAFGFALLLVTFAIPAPAYNLALVWQITGLVLTLIALAGSIAGIAWRSRTLAAEAPRAAARAEWRGRPPTSAFDYATAHSSDSPTTSPPPSPPPSRGP